MTKEEKYAADQKLFAKLCELLIPFSDEDRIRIIKCVAILLDIKFSDDANT
jgi:hypothetical protein